MGTTLLRSLLGLAVIAAVGSADTVTTTNRKRYEGRILKETESEVVIRTYGDGDVTIPRSEIQTVRRSKNKFDEYDRRLKKKGEPKSIEEHLATAKWCKKKKLKQLAEKHWRAIVALDDQHEGANKALGHKKVDGQWIDPEQVYRDKGWIKHKGKWISPEEMKRVRQEEALKSIKHRIKLNITFKPDAPESQLESWRSKVKFWSGIIWDMSAGMIWIEEVHISDKSEEGDCVVVNLDSLNIDARGNSGLAKVLGHKFWVGGLCNAFVFVHEFFHAWGGVPDHYGTKIQCLMNSSERSRIFTWSFCDPCWKKIQKNLKLERRAGWSEEELPGTGSPGKHGSAEDFGDPPEMKITVSDS